MVIMEDPKTPETLEANNPNLELLEEASEAIGFLTLSGRGDGLGSILDVHLEENGNVVGENSLAVDVKENGVCEEGCLLNGLVDGKNVDQMDFAAAELGDERLEDRVDGENNINVVIEPIRDEGEKEDDGDGSVRRIEDSGDNISLYVDFSGPLTEAIGTGLTISEELKEAANDELIADGQGYQFYAGDVVWVRTKSQTWWPGKIYDPSDAPENALEGDWTNFWLIGYFGSSHVAWCHPSQLKPFHLDFEQMTGQNKARTFISAVEKAIEDFGKSLQLEMTCSCVIKENKFLANNSATENGASVPGCTIGELGKFSAAEFEPAEFLCKLKNLAEAVSKPGMLDFVALKSRLLAFYSSVGHCCLPIHQLWEMKCDAENASSSLAEENNLSYNLVLEPSDVTKNGILQLNQNGDLAKIPKEHLGELLENCGSIVVGDAIASSSRKRKKKNYCEVRTSSIPSKEPDQGMGLSSVENGNDKAECKNEKGLDLRERRRSKYLSYPYVIWESKQLSETDGPNALKVSQEGVKELIKSPSVVKSSANSIQKKCRKFRRGDDITAYPELMNTSCADLLSELQFIAVDCLYPTKSKNLDLIEWFFYRFRVSVYHDCKNLVNQKEAAAIDSCLSGNEMEDRKKLTDAGSKIKSLSGLSGGDISFGRCKLLVNEFQEIASDTATTKQTLATTKQTLAGQQTKQTINIPDLNGYVDVPMSMSKDSPVMCQTASEPRKRKRKRVASKPLKTEITHSLFVANGHNANSNSFMLDFQIRRPCSVKTIPKPSNMEGLNVGLPDSSGNYASGKPDTLLFAAESKPGPKKRGRKPKALPGHPTHLLSVGIPDLNGTSAEPNILGKDFQETNGVLPVEKPVRKRRRRRKGEASLISPNVIVNYHKAVAKVKPLGTTLLLTFTPGVTMPSKEVLLATFCKFGPLKESEFLIIKESNSAQIVFMRSEDAQRALQSLENSNPFGVSLLNYHLRNDTIRTAQPIDGLRMPLEPSASIPNLVESPPIDFIRQNLDRMTSMLQKSGDNLSPDVKAKLESEIKGLMEKVSSFPSYNCKL